MGVEGLQQREDGADPVVAAQLGAGDQVEVHEPLADVAAAETSAGALGDLERLARRYRLLRVALVAAVVVPAVCTGLVPLLGSLSLLGRHIGDDAAAAIGMPLYLATMLPMVILGMRAFSRRYAARVRQLAQGQGPDAIPPLLDLLRADVRQRRGRWTMLVSEVVPLLTELLPQLRAGHAGMLSDRHRDTLNLVLGRCVRFYSSSWRRYVWRRRARLYQPGFIVAVLRALEQVGDRSAVPYVAALADVPATSRDAQQIQDAARACLPSLQQNAGRVEMARTLLRPASAAGAASDVLLRPATGAGTSDPEKLLRPSGANETPPTSG